MGIHYMNNKVESFFWMKYNFRETLQAYICLNNFSALDGRISKLDLIIDGQYDIWHIL